jgi:hypothetical protein
MINWEIAIKNLKYSFIYIKKKCMSIITYFSKDVSTHHSFDRTLIRIK